MSPPASFSGCRRDGLNSKHGDEASTNYTNWIRTRRPSTEERKRERERERGREREREGEKRQGEKGKVRDRTKSTDRVRRAERYYRPDKVATQSLEKRVST